MSTEPKRAVWVSTFGLYNSGRLIGAWFDLHDDDVPEDVEAFVKHPRIASQLAGVPANDIGEEVWCFDIEGFAENVEMSPAEAVSLHDEIVSMADRHGCDESVIVAAMGQGMDIVNLDYYGTYDTFQEYAAQVADEMLGARADATDFVSRYFDYAMFARDLAMDYTLVETPDHSVMVFGQ